MSKRDNFDRSVTTQQNMVMRVPGYFVFTDITELKTCPPASIVQAAVNLIRQEKNFSDKIGKPIDLDIKMKQQISPLVNCKFSPEPV